MAVIQTLLRPAGRRRSVEEIQKERKIADALRQRAGDTSPVAHWTQGLARVADGVIGALTERQLDADQKATDAFTAERGRGLVEAAMLDRSAPRSTAATAAPSAPPGPVAGTMENARAADRMSVPGYAGMDLKSGITSTAEALGIDPVDLATVISYETAGTFDPTKSGPTTQWGTHRGLIQFGEPQAAKYGVNWDDPLGSQLGPQGAVANYLRDAGVRPGMGILDVYSAINAGQVGRYNASDANNGGAPGTVRDKVNNQMAGHREKALALLGGGARVNEPTLVYDDKGMRVQPPASGRPMEPPGFLTQSRGIIYDDKGARAAPVGPWSVAPAAYAPQPAAGDAMAAANTMAEPPAPLLGAAPKPPQANVAEALAARQPNSIGPGGAVYSPYADPAAPEFIPPPTAAERATPRGMAYITDVLSDPNAPAGQQRLAMALLEREMARGEPVKPIEVNGRLVDPNTFEVIADFSDKKGAEQFTLGEGQVRFDAQGNPIARGPDRGAKDVAPTQLSRLIDERNALAADDPMRPVYDQAIAKEAAGSGMAVEVGPDGTVKFAQGTGAGKAWTEGQSKDNVYATRAMGALETLEPNADALTSLLYQAAGLDPTGVVRGRVQSDAYQLARQAGDEFLQAILRKDTGAAITADEQDLYGKTYLPQPGDGPAVLAQKKAARARAVEAMKAGMMPLQIIAAEKALGRTPSQSGGAPAAAPQPAGTVGVDRIRTMPEAELRKLDPAQMTVEELRAAAERLGVAP